MLKAEREDSSDYPIMKNNDEPHNMRVNRSCFPFDFLDSFFKISRRVDYLLLYRIFYEYFIINIYQV